MPEGRREVEERSWAWGRWAGQGVCHDQGVTVGRMWLFYLKDLGDFAWGQTGEDSLQLLQRGDWGGFINWLHGGEGKAAEQGQWEDRGRVCFLGDRRDQKS